MTMASVLLSGLTCLLLTAVRCSDGHGVNAPDHGSLETVVQQLAADVSKLQAGVTQLEGEPALWRWGGSILEV